MTSGHVTTLYLFTCSSSSVPLAAGSMNDKLTIQLSTRCHHHLPWVDAIRRFLQAFLLYLFASFVQNGFGNKSCVQLQLSISWVDNCINLQGKQYGENRHFCIEQWMVLLNLEYSRQRWLYRKTNIMKKELS